MSKTAQAPASAEKSCSHGGHAGDDHHHHHADPAKTARDPVCGMSVNPETSRHRFEYNGTTYHFCSNGCRTKFEADPSKYIDKSSADAPKQPVPEGTIYTCPMHPEIRQVGPGSCPICGMALEPDVVSLDAAPNPELADMTRRFWIGAALSVPPVVLEMGGHLTGGHGLIGQTLSNWIQLVFATPVVLWAGWPFFVRGWQSLVTRNLNMFTLIAMGTGVAYVYSLIGTLVPPAFPATFRGHDGAVAVYFEAAAVITVLVLLGQVLELRAREATSGAIKALLKLAPKTARRVGDDGADHEVEIDTLKTGDRLRVRPGDRVPVDGVILEGRSALDESLVTGESMPVTKEAGARVIAGTLNQSGSFVMRADKVGRETLLAQIVHGRGCAAFARADPTARRSGRGLVRACGDCCGDRGFHSLGNVWSGAAACLWSGCRRQRAHHRLPLRARPCHTDVDYGWRRPRRSGRRTDQECRSAGAHGEGRHAGRRQNRHADRGQAERDGDCSSGRLPAERNPETCRERRAVKRTSAGGCDRARSEAARA